MSQEKWHQRHAPEDTRKMSIRHQTAPATNLPPRLPLLETIACVSAVCLLILVLPDLFAQSVGAGQGPANRQSTSRDARYYDRLLDSTFYDVNRVVELGMDYALTYKAKIEKEFVEWVTGRSLKDPEQEDYFQAMHALDQGWDLLLKSATIYHQSRERQTDDATTERLREEAHRIYQQGVEKVREANRLRKAADEKRSARKRADEEKVEREKEAANQRSQNEVKSLSAQFEQLNADEAKEDDLHNLNIANIESTAAGNPKRRQALLNAEDGRHERRMTELDKRRNELGNKMLGGNANGTDSREAPDYKSADDVYPRSDRQALKDADECFPLAPKRYEGCGTTLARERTRWASEAAKNKRDIERENERNKRRLATMSKGSPGSNPGQETECHERNARQLEEESNTLQERHRKCFARLMR